MTRIIGPALAVTAIILWIAGLQLFLAASLSVRRKLLWTALLIATGIGAGLVLPSDRLRSTFVLVMILLPVLAVADVLLLRSHRGMTYWLRACGFETGTVFGVAATARYLLDAMRTRP